MANGEIVRTGIEEKNIARRKEIERKIATEEDGLRRYMNNFYTRLPGYEYGQTPTFNLIDRKEFEVYNGMDPDILYGEQGKREERSRDGGEDSYSELYLGMTPRQFFQEVDSALAETGVSREDVKAKRLEFQTGAISCYEFPEQMSMLGLQVYLLLIQKGFTWRDLCQ